MARNKVRLKLTALLTTACIGYGVALIAAPTWAQPPVETPKPVPVVAAPVARGYLLRAGDALVDKPTGGTELAPDEKQKLVERNAEALQILREGFAHERGHALPPFDKDAPQNNEILFSLARLLVAEGQAHAARGEIGRAVNSYLDVIRLGVEIMSGAPLNGSLYGMAIEAMGRRPLWEISGDLNAATARQCARRLEIIEMRRSPFADSLRAEKAYGEKELVEFLKGMTPYWDKEQAMTTFASLMDAEIAQAQMPYIASTQHPAPAGTKKDLPNYKNPLAPTTPEMTEVMFEASKSVINHSRYSETHNQTHNALLRAVWALRAYQLEHGHFPESLAQLAPEYIEQVPLDPFSLKKPLQYKVMGDKYLLYSVGPDGVDDGGAPIEYAETKSRQANSLGDIVAWINLR